MHQTPSAFKSRCNHHSEFLCYSHTSAPLTSILLSQITHTISDLLPNLTSLPSPTFSRPLRVLIHFDKLHLSVLSLCLVSHIRALFTFLRDFNLIVTSIPLTSIRCTHVDYWTLACILCSHVPLKFGLFGSDPIYFPVIYLVELA
jgi:hypothetical protein